MEKIDLTDGGSLLLNKEFLKEEIANELYRVIKSKTPWKQEKTRFGKMMPRLTMWYADSGLKYAYSGVVHAAVEWPDYLIEIKRRIQLISGDKFNSILLNYYRDGNDSIGFHSDNEKELGLNPVVASVSLGSEREFVIKHIETKETHKYTLTNGSLLIMGGTMQNFWLHGVPKTKNEVGGRINLTFRNIVS